jgi:ketosteroid isomerase-like protein
MTAAKNKRLMEGLFDELAQGNGKPFVEALAEDVRWTIIGGTAWSGTWQGFEAVRKRLLDPLFAQFETAYRAKAVRVIAEGDFVVIESRGDVITKSGKPYRNTYCNVYRLEDGKVVEITEYCDTQLLTEALAPPETTVAA